MEVTNGFAYKTAADVDYARKNLANPKQGSGGVNAEPPANPRAGDPVIQFGGALQAPQANPTADAERDRARRDRERAEAEQARQAERKAERKSERRVDIRA